MTSPIHCTKCWCIFDYKELYDIHIQFCETNQYKNINNEQFMFGLIIADYWNPSVNKLNKLRCNVVDKYNNTCLRLLSDGLCYCHYHKVIKR
jgi:hypothetical protein